VPNWTDPMIYDRTAADISNRTAKAFFNVSDWLRVYGNSELAHALTELYTGLSVSFTTLTPPAITTFPSVTAINSLIQNIDNCRAAAYLPAATGIVALDYDFTEGPGGTAPDYTDVNAWEQDLQLIRDALTAAVDYQVYCGVAATGQTRFYQNRWRRFPWVGPAVSPVRRPRCGVAASGQNMTRQNRFRRYS